MVFHRKQGRSNGMTGNNVSNVTGYYNIKQTAN